MSNGDDGQLTRKSHVVRIYQNDDPGSEKWVDIERLDELQYRHGGPGSTTRVIKWTFDWDQFDPDNAPHKTIKQNRDDDDSDGVSVPIRDSVVVTMAAGNQYQTVRHFFGNDKDNKTRVTHSRRVYHHDIPDDVLVDGQPPSDPQEYLNVGDPNPDKDQYAEVEMLDRYYVVGHPSKDILGYSRPSSYQLTRWLLDNDSDPLLFDESTDDPDFKSVSNPGDGVQIDPPWRLDPLQNIVNVQLGGEAFLYSGADGMFRSGDGQSWTKLDSSVPASSLAFVDGIWVASDFNTGNWRSDDGAQTWSSTGGPPFQVVVAIKPKGKDENGQDKPGIFAGWHPNDDNNTDDIYTSFDLGKTWSRVKTIDRGGDEGGYEFVNNLNGCGEGLFISTTHGDRSYSNGDGYVYSSTDGLSFSGGMVFGPGTAFDPSAPSTGEQLIHGFDAQGVAYDAETDTYAAFGHEEQAIGGGSFRYSQIYTRSTSPSFGGAGFGISFASSINNVNDGGTIVASGVVGGGGGRFVEGHSSTQYGIGFKPIFNNIIVTFIGGGEQMLGTAFMDDPGAVAGMTDICFKGPKTKSSSTDTSTSGGTFALVAFAGHIGGVYVAKPGGVFNLTHQGSIATAATVAVGSVASAKAKSSS